MPRDRSDGEPFTASERPPDDGNLVPTDRVTRAARPARRLGRVLIHAGRPLPLRTWLAVPILFAAAVLGLTAIIGVLIDADWLATLSPALFGSAAAVTALIGVGPEWPRCRRTCARVAYPAAVFTAGLLVGGVAVPTSVAVLVGLPALATLGYLCRQERPDDSVVVD
jgi:hypothetical protein